jgi:predicted methyltransferase
MPNYIEKINKNVNIEEGKKALENILLYMKLLMEPWVEHSVLPINCKYVDFSEPLDNDFKNQFDCFFTDPPYTIEGMNIFFLEELKP